MDRSALWLSSLGLGVFALTFAGLHWQTPRSAHPLATARALPAAAQATATLIVAPPWMDTPPQQGAPQQGDSEAGAATDEGNPATRDPRHRAAEHGARSR